MLALIVSKVWLLVLEVLVLEVLAVPNQYLQAVELEKQVGKVNEPNQISDIAHASRPLRHIVVVLLVVQGGVAVAQELGSRVIVLHRNNSNESGYQEKYQPQHVEVEEPRVPLVQLVLNILSLLLLPHEPPRLHVGEEQGQLEYDQAGQADAHRKGEYCNYLPQGQNYFKQPNNLVALLEVETKAEFVLGLFLCFGFPVVVTHICRHLDARYL